MKIYRNCAGIIIFNTDKKVLVCARNDASDFNWQFPQGGIENNEKPSQAALRELKEETSITSVKPVKCLNTAIMFLSLSTRFIVASCKSSFIAK